MKLLQTDHIVTAYAQPASGPGWANTPIWVVIRDAEGKLRQEAIQPEEQTKEMKILYGICAQAHMQLLGWVLASLNKPKRKKTK